MLETEEVDQDYFTPAASTSLANIFDNTTKPDNGSGNSSLKYTAPKPQVPKSSQEENIGLIPIFRCLVDGHQWVNKIYSAKGKIGCSILKVTKDPQTDGALIMVLYDSNKHTLCSISLTYKLQVTVKQNGFLTFYESKEKIWSIYGSQEDIQKILDYCKSKNVQLIYSEIKATGPTGSDNKDKHEISDSTDTECEDLGTKSKASILSRMANMGKSVLPQIVASNEDTSSSSDEDKNRKQIILDKGLVKRNTADPKCKKKVVKTNPEKAPAEIRKLSIEESTQDTDDLLMMIQNTKTSSNSANSMDLFITEQRINNSELRININRVHDKVDKLLTKVNDLGNKSNNDGNNINNELLQKLLKEYESKNKVYEELLRPKSNIASSSETDIPSTTNLLAIDSDNNQFNTKITDLEAIIRQKDNEIQILNDEVKKLRNVNELQSIEEKDKLYKKISEFDKLSTKNNELLEKLLKQNEQFCSSNNDTLLNQIKAIMNETFHGIVDNFDYSEKYSGEEIRNVVEKVIKKVTITSLKNLRAD